jgi:hypothetical protein
MQNLQKNQNGYVDVNFHDRGFSSCFWGSQATPCTCKDVEREHRRDALIGRFGFLFNGFKRQGAAPFWEVLPITLRKVFLLIIVVRLENFPVVIQILMALILVFFALLLQVKPLVDYFR